MKNMVRPPCLPSLLVRARAETESRTHGRPLGAYRGGELGIASVRRDGDGEVDKRAS